MRADSNDFPPDLSGMSRAEWLGALRQTGQELGFSESLGRKHAGIFVEAGDVLLVSFETMSGIEATSETRTPLGFQMLSSHDWSSLSLLSHGDTWFRDPEIYRFFDQMMDDGFFDEFDTIVFYGAGPCGYAAATLSVAAPGARVLVLQPQATLDPRMTEWDDRFVEERRRDFTSRYGFAPDMLEAAHEAYVVYDPQERLDAMHAALFARKNVTRFRAPYMGGGLQNDFLTLDILPTLLEATADDTLDTALFARLLRARREHPPYLRRVLSRLDAAERPQLARMLCRNVTERMHAPRIARRLAQLESSAKQA